MSLHNITLFDANNSDFESSPCNGCGAKCCQDLKVGLREHELSVMERGNRVTESNGSPQVLELSAGLKLLTNGLYVSKQGTIYKGVLVGPCRNLNPDGSCSVEEEKPLMCINEPVDGRLCMEARATRPPAIERF